VKIAADFSRSWHQDKATQSRVDKAEQTKCNEMRQLTFKTDHNNLLKGEGEMKTVSKFSPVLFVAAFCFVLMGAIALGQETAGPNNAGTGSNVDGPGTVTWTHPEYIQNTADANYATAVLGTHATSEYLKGTNYGFSIPSNATIVGIQVTIRRKSSSNAGGNSINDVTVSLIKDGLMTVANKASAADWGTSFGTASYGSASDLWEASWTPDDINANDFGVALSAYNQSGYSNRTATVDYMQITVTYTVPLPIQMASFAANVVRNNDVEVAWKTVSETNNYGFEIYRKRGDAGEWAKIGFVQGHGTTLALQSYTYVDAGLSFGKYYYQIKQIDLDGKSETFPLMTVNVGVAPERLTLAQNYPNPFNPSTVIEFVVPMSGHATMKVYNVLGQEVATLFDGNAEAGRINSARFDASNLPSGLYFYTLKSSGTSETKRMLLTK
jgi:hypothetical protein